MAAKLEVGPVSSRASPRHHVYRRAIERPGDGRRLLRDGCTASAQNADECEPGQNAYACLGHGASLARNGADVNTCPAKVRLPTVAHASESGTSSYARSSCPSGTR